MKHHNHESDVIDPVCGMTLSRKTAAEEFEHNGRTYYFCAEICRETFESNPDKYIRHHRQHGASHA